MQKDLISTNKEIQCMLKMLSLLSKKNAKIQVKILQLTNFETTS